ncbi:hypothetical protein [Amycolatopsis nalaikhensis]|uniref:RAMA domain-containing protein n=1 Tax=Amycolatopsis nalaikhensis TaxID=715472 RepID=A0ABY8XZG0_9PSEU|nr:hypothetical protein [Amycolatopsis sp. 2-2]WIV60730.1 hypothetical protein QP939_20005 [Amycolatopsis sp. 2-2]
MKLDRHVRLHASSRTIRIGDEVLRYAGVTVLRVENGKLIGQSWVPLGANPSYADDEALVATWHAALQWSHVDDIASSPVTPPLDS